MALAGGGGCHQPPHTHRNIGCVANLKNGIIVDAANGKEGNGNGNGDPKDEQFGKDPKHGPLGEDHNHEPLGEEPTDQLLVEDHNHEPLGEVPTDQLLVEDHNHEPLGEVPTDQPLGEHHKHEPLGEDNTEEQSNEVIYPPNGEQEVVCQQILVASTPHQLIVTEPEIEEQQSATSIRTEIVKSVLYGGLTELIASLGIVTSSASTGATTGKTVALSLSNLIIGLFVMSYRISKHWINGQESGADEQREEEVDTYEQVFGDRQNHRLHLTVAIISFLILGLVPPLLYGFTFRKPEDKFLKIPTVTIVSVLCIGLLGVGKAYIEKPENCLVYVHIIGGCIADAIGTSAVTTFGGELIQNYVDRAGWFDFEPNKVPTLLLPGMDFRYQTWRSV